MGADTDGLIDSHHAFLERVEALRKVYAAKVAAAERTFEARVRTAIFHSTQARTVALTHTLSIFEMDRQVVVLRGASQSATDGLMASGIMCVKFAKVSATVLAGMCRRIRATRKPATNLAFACCHMNRPAS